MNFLLDEFGLQNIIALVTYLGIGQIWHRIKIEIEQNTLYLTSWSTLIIRWFNLIIVVDAILMIVYCMFWIYLAYAHTWSDILYFTLLQMISAIAIRLIYRNVEGLKLTIEHLFIFIFWLRPILLVRIMYDYFVQ